MAKRETDTMPNWAGSSWYWIRYMDPNNDKEFASREALDYWGHVDYYNGDLRTEVTRVRNAKIIQEVQIKEDANE